MSLFSRTQKTPSKEEQILQKVGLSRQEALIYMVLLGTDGGTVGDISRLSAMHRPSIYRTLPSLMAKGLLSREFKGKRTIYKATSPTQLRPVFENLSQEIEEGLPELEERFRQTSRRPAIKTIEGRRALPFLLLDLVYTLNKGETYYRYSSALPSRYDNPDILPKTYVKLRDEKQIQRLVITSEQIANKHKQDGKRTVKIAPKDYGLLDHNVSQFIYGNKVAFIDYTNDLLLLIEHDRIAKFQSQLFKMLFDRL